MKSTLVGYLISADGSDGPIKRLGSMGRGGHPLAGECIGADASDGHQHAYDVEEGTRLAEEVAGEEDHDKPPDSVEHGVRRHLYGPRPKAVAARP